MNRSLTPHGDNRLTGLVTDTSSFEAGLDGWTTGGMDRPFMRRSGSASTSVTGPSSAADGSYYVYAHADWNYNQNFDLEKTFPTGQELYGVAFQYHMYGADMGSAVLESSATGTNWASLWSKSGDQGNQWLQATVYAGGGQTMLRYTCVRAQRAGGVTSCDESQLCSPLRLLLTAISPHQVHVRIKLPRLLRPRRHSARGLFDGGVCRIKWPAMHRSFWHL